MYVRVYACLFKTLVILICYKQHDIKTFKEKISSTCLTQAKTKKKFYAKFIGFTPNVENFSPDWALNVQNIENLLQNANGLENLLFKHNFSKQNLQLKKR